jgi:aspartate/tyrosine/aromatic aminotransferase
LRYYGYWDPARKGVNFDVMLENLKKAPENSVIVLHMTAHNPTGCDLTREQWTLVADVMEVSPHKEFRE